MDSMSAEVDWCGIYRPFARLYPTKRTLLEAVTQVERQYLFEGVNEVSEACAQR